MKAEAIGTIIGGIVGGASVIALLWTILVYAVKAIRGWLRR
jgi:hypothetical protein